ncbi:hypothetical protein GCM10010442_13310 [Kitasatospora kifunensis]
MAPLLGDVDVTVGGEVIRKFELNADHVVLLTLCALAGHHSAECVRNEDASDEAAKLQELE